MPDLLFKKACKAMIWTWDGHVGKGHWASFKVNGNCLDSNARA